MMRTRKRKKNEKKKRMMKRRRKRRRRRRRQWMAKGRRWMSRACAYDLVRGWKILLQRAARKKCSPSSRRIVLRWIRGMRGHRRAESWCVLGCLPWQSRRKRCSEP